MNAIQGARRAISVATSVLVVTACSTSDKSATADSSAAAASAPAATDTGMTGMDHSKMAGMDHSQMATNRGAAKDADHEFLRMMSDHHEGLVVMMRPAMDKATSSTAKADAKKLHDKQGQERDSMVAMIKSSYDETITPMVMPSGKAMNDSLQQKSGAAYDRDMYRHVVMHHQEGVKMIDDFLPRLKRSEVRQMAEKMRADQQREIQEFQKKQSS
jgi:uncharacterized protein (DUF305 family)